ncbi:hypothetical protein B0T19DRAFT_482143 [Cercophora scortea]|uniref:Uncharacterized protein n=1 Tax=Cercophora scortea TaxID=314031 RepID=A0AAE0MGH7_9PEZI|nr:hypothetical protein B0T19DRAFT_482143 [Cercophora scortea]
MPHLKPYPRDRDSSTYGSSSSAANEGRECHVDGCFHKHCYAKVDGRRVYSRFCILHRCQKTVPNNPGYHCPFAKEERDSFCRNHMTCGDYNCLERGEYEGEARNLPWFCNALPTCPNQASPETNRCSEHRVTTTRRRTCKAPNCDKTPRRRRDDSSELEDECEEHWNKCIFAGCGRFRHEAGAGPYCHRCTMDNCPTSIPSPPPGATGTTTTTPVFCHNHACQTPKCPRSRLNTLTTFCQDHICARADGKCTRQGADGVGSFCAVHECREPTCHNEARFENGFCEEKHACVEARCSRGRIVVDDGEFGEGEVPARCLRHERMFWRAEGRREVEEEMTRGKEEEQLQQRRGREAARRRVERRGSGPARGAAGGVG